MYQLIFSALGPRRLVRERNEEGFAMPGAVPRPLSALSADGTISFECSFLKYTLTKVTATF